jgi:hypothetical protein
MKRWKNNPLPIQWLWLSKDDKRAVIKLLDKTDIEFLTDMKNTFNATVLEMEIIDEQR